MKTTLYQEECGETNTEYGNDGVKVTLTRWDDEATYDNSSHYLLEKRVVVDREIIIDSIDAFETNYPNTDPAMIRKAISEFDKLVSNHPNLPAEVQP